MYFSFKVNKNLLAASLLLQPSGEQTGLTKLQNLLWEKHRDAYELLNTHERRLMFVGNYKKKLESVAEKMEALITDVEKSEEFVRVYRETLAYRDWLETEWSSKKDEVEGHLWDILKTNLPLKKFEVLVIHQAMKTGLYLGESRILWGHVEGWNNYSVVYLVHEALHNCFDKSEATHALLELTIDNELRIRLNGSGEYFGCGGKTVGHDYLRELEQKILPRWKEYLEQSTDKGNIFDLINELRRNNNVTERSGG